MKLRSFLTLLSSLLFLKVFSQDTKLIQFQKDIIENHLMNYSGETRIAAVIDSSWIDTSSGDF